MKKAFISADIEGMEGNVSRMQSWRSKPDYTIARKRLAEDVNAAIRACFDSGYDEVYVCDGHGDMENLILEDMDPRCKLISGSMRNSLQMEGIDSTFDAYISFGHAGAGQHVGGVYDHCFNGFKIYNLRFNGVTMNTETVADALVAGFYGVPLVCCIGDVALAEECKAFVPNMETVVVKEGITRYSAVSIHPTVARKKIYDGVMAALARRDEIKPLRLDNMEELTMEVDYKDSNSADAAVLIPGVKRLNPRSVSFTGDPETVFKLQEVLLYRLLDVVE